MTGAGEVVWSGLGGVLVVLGAAALSLGRRLEG